MGHTNQTPLEYHKKYYLAVFRKPNNDMYWRVRAEEIQSPIEVKDHHDDVFIENLGPHGGCKTAAELLDALSANSAYTLNNDGSVSPSDEV